MSDPSPKLTVLQPKPIPPGTPEYEDRRTTLHKTFAQKVPLDLCLLPEFFVDPPVDVSRVPATCGMLTPNEVDITETYDAVGLAEAIAARKWTAVEVATAFCKRSIIAHQLTCCLTQWFMPEALAQAKELDVYMEQNGKPIGPLHGVPVSIKEHMPVAGTFSSYGSMASTRYDEEDCYMISTLRRMGAVFYCKTNQPQLIMHLESTSHYGRTLNPFNTNLSAGGSSGGEAALIAMKGSVLGVGSDIGGSIRGPSAFCGIYGYKATSYTLPQNRFVPHSFAAELNVTASTGPMCRSLRDMDFFTKIILSTKPYLRDPGLIPLPWTGLKTEAKKPLRVGLMWNDGFIHPQPPVTRAVAWALERLSEPKYANILHVKSFKPFNAAEAWTYVRRMYWPDGGKGARDDVLSTGEPILPLSDWGFKDATSIDGTGVNELRDQRDRFRYDFAESWNDQEVDIVIGPAFVGPASAHDTAFYWTYTSLFNLVDYPGVVVPTPCIEHRLQGDTTKDSWGLNAPGILRDGTCSISTAKSSSGGHRTASLRATLVSAAHEL
jgi:amidase